MRAPEGDGGAPTSSVDGGTAVSPVTGPVGGGWSGLLFYHSRRWWLREGCGIRRRGFHLKRFDLVLSKRERNSLYTTTLFLDYEIVFAEAGFHRRESGETQNGGYNL